jgi:hypothetical protein
MALLKDYLFAVRLYLPGGPDQSDILSELSAHLQTKLDEREEELGRPLTQDEETEVLWGYGHPLQVAARYGSPKLGLSFGRELIGPEVFVIYRAVLILQFSLTLIVKASINMIRGVGLGSIGDYLSVFATQFVLTTSIFIAIDLFKRRSQQSKTWSFPPPHMQPIPRWQSITGFITLGLVAIWWAAIPYAPVLLLGSTSSQLTFTDGWHWFYWPLLIPLLVGAAQRLVTFVEPRWSALQSVTRLLTNGWCVFMVFQFLSAFPYVAPTSPASNALAQGVNNGMWWNALSSLGLYWLFNFGFMIFLCVKHVSHYQRQRRDQVLVRQSEHS